MKLTVIIVEDNFYALEELKYLLEKYFNIEIKATFESALDAIEYLVKNGSVDIVFCDIRMPKVNGLEGGQTLVNLCKALAFTTGHPQYAEEALAMGAEAYLVKPVKKEELKELIDKVVAVVSLEHEEAMRAEFFFIKDSLTSGFRTIAIEGLHYMLGGDGEITVFGDHGSITSVDTLNRVEDVYCGLGSAFIRIHRSAIAVKSAIKGFKDRKVFFVDGGYHNVGNKYLSDFKNYYKNKAFK